MLSRYFSVVALLLAAHAVADSFDNIDRNHDGTLDRQEFSVFSQHLRNAIDPLIQVDGSNVASGAVKADNSASAISSLTAGDDFLPASFNALLVILITEIGDKTFFIAAVLAMRSGRLIVYLGAMGALAVMHILSCLMGYTLPALLPRTYTHYASALLFVYFGFRLLNDAYNMSDGPSEELQEVEEELINKKEENTGQDIEDGGEHSQNATTSLLQNNQQLAVFTQAFTLTFLAEWGDRSQIATIALASSKNPFGVILGGLIGHAFCTGLAVVGGRMLAARISEKTVAYSGGVLFIIFAIHSFLVGP